MKQNSIKMQLLLQRASIHHLFLPCFPSFYKLQNITIKTMSEPFTRFTRKISYFPQLWKTEQF